jgi:glycosyltransferase involved in cell wall biosynthesis
MDWLSILWLCCYIPVVIGLSLFGLHRWSMVYLFWKNWRKPPQPKGRLEKLPLVTVQLPIFNELHVVRRLVDAVAKLDWPKELLQIQILDDSTDETQDICAEELERLKREGFDAEMIHRVDRTGFKAGALENAMPSVKGEFIYILDADFVPPVDVLHRLVHFFTDEKIALVQSRWGHINMDYSLLTKIQAIFLDGHLVVEQVARSRSGRFFNFNGTGGIWRKQAIIDAGGWEHDTLTEDLDLSYRAQMKGWRFIYLNDVVTPAELPVDMNGFKTQQFRWTKGSIQCCRKLFGAVWRSEEPLYRKLEATVHLTTNFAYLLLVFLCFLIFPGTDRALTQWLGDARTWVVDLPVFVLTAVSVGLFYITGQMGSHPGKWYSKIIYMPGALALGIGLAVNSTRAIIEALLKKESPFVRTPKYGIEQKGQDYRKAKYKSLKTWGMGIELLLAGYFTYVTIYGILNFKNYWLSVPFYILFASGFWYVLAGSLSQLFQSRYSNSSGGTPAA